MTSELRQPNRQSSVLPPDTVTSPNRGIGRKANGFRRGTSASSRRRTVRAMFIVFPAVLILSVTISSAGALTRAGRRKAVPQPPVITETFNPVIGCNPNTTIGQEGCGEHRVLADDARLNADIKVVFGLLSGKVARRDFVIAQTTWLTYRRADCKSQSAPYQGGTEQPVVYVYCLGTDDISRRQELKEFYQGLTRGLDKVPKFP